LPRGTDDVTETDAMTVGLEDLATRWLEAETRSHGEAANSQFADDAASLGEEYEAAVGVATQEELRLAWEAAKRRQAEEEIGSSGWADARRVSELLRSEYLASQPTRKG
jgi:hypothetical protein